MDENAAITEDLSWREETEARERNGTKRIVTIIGGMITDKPVEYEYFYLIYFQIATYFLQRGKNKQEDYVLRFCV